MQVTFDPKTNEATIKLSVNPNSTQESSTGKTFLLAFEASKHEVGGVEARVQVTITRPTQAGKKAKRK